MNDSAAARYIFLARTAATVGWWRWAKHFVVTSCSADYGLGSVWVSAMIWSGATCPPSTNIRFASQRCATPRAVRLPASRARSALQLGTSLCMAGLLKLVLH